MEIYYQYVRLRRQFGRHAKFVDGGAEMLADIRPNGEHSSACVTKNPVTTVAQCVPEVSEHDANTNAVIYASKAMSHVEGGWPKDVDYTEAEHTIRYRKKAEKDEEFVRTLAALGAAVEGLIKQNNAIDIYEEYFAGYAADHSAEPPSAATVTVFRDPRAAPGAHRRAASCVSWHPDGASKAAVSYSILGFQQQPPGMAASSYVFDVASPNAPESELAGLSQLVCARFNLKDGNVIGAGQYNGQFSLFDTRKGPAPVETTPIDICHRDPVYDMAWLQSKTGTEAMTVSTDGSVLWWDIRRMGEALESMPLREKGSDVLLGGLVLEYDPQAGPTKFMVGTEQGVVLNCNRKAKNPADRVGSSFTGHHGPVYGVRRNPFFSKYFLTLGDWTARVWNEDMRAPLITGRYAPSYITGGSWSPTRPGVYYTTQMDGSLEVWDLFHKHNEPTLTVKVTDQALTSFAVQSNGAVVAVGTVDGATHVLRLSAGLAEMAQNEKQGINAMLERETLREKNLDKAAKEAKVKARREAVAAADLGSGVSDQDLADLEEEFWRATGVEGGTRLRLDGLDGGGGGGGGGGARGAQSAGTGDAAAAGEGGGDAAGGENGAE